MSSNNTNPDELVYNPREKKFVTREEDKKLSQQQNLSDIASGKEMSFVRKNREYSDKVVSEKQKNIDEAMQRVASSLTPEKIHSAEKQELETLKSDPLIFGKNPISDSFGSEADRLHQKDINIRARINQLEENQSRYDSNESKNVQAYIDHESNSRLEKSKFDETEKNKDWITKQIIKDNPFNDISVDKDSTLSGMSPNQILDKVKKDALELSRRKSRNFSI
jgi:hypothetical protein